VSRQRTLFAFARPSVVRVRRAHVFDAGDDEYGNMICQFSCNHCGHRTHWMPVKNLTTARLGIPCPNCNEGQRGDDDHLGGFGV
jgi:hypothetical protein